MFYWLYSSVKINWLTFAKIINTWRLHVNSWITSFLTLSNVLPMSNVKNTECKDHKRHFSIRPMCSHISVEHIWNSNKLNTTYVVKIVVRSVTLPDESGYLLPYGINLLVKPGFHIIAPIAPIAPIARNSVQAIRAIHCFHLIAPIACEVECTGQVLDPSLIFSRQMEWKMAANELRI